MAAAAAGAGCGHRDRRPRHADALVAVGQLDLAEMGLVEELRQLADELGIQLEFLPWSERSAGWGQRASRRDEACNARR